MKQKNYRPAVSFILKDAKQSINIFRELYDITGIGKDIIYEPGARRPAYRHNLSLRHEEPVPRRTAAEYFATGRIGSPVAFCRREMVV
jgi:hypothetical protein